MRKVHEQTFEQMNAYLRGGGRPNQKLSAAEYAEVVSQHLARIKNGSAAQAVRRRGAN